MAKPSYKIPNNLDKSWLDIEIAFMSDNGVGTRPLPMKFLLCIAFSLVGCLGIVLNTPIRDGGVPFIALFVLLWIATSVFLFKLDKTGEMAMAKVPVVFDYIPRSNRHVLTRTTSPAGPFSNCSNLDDVDKDRGMVKFLDGDVGFAFRVVGSGSILLFDEDKDAILDRVDTFFRKMKADYELIFVTAREPQNVVRQVQNMENRMTRFTSAEDAELLALASTERMYLSEFVGKRFRSIHQYLVIKARNEEALELGFNMLRTEIEGSMLMFKRCVSIYDEELEALFESVYGGKGRAA